MSVEIVQVRTKDELKKFVKFNLSLYKDSPFHIPVLIDEEVKILDKDTNPAFEFCESVYFLAYKDNKIVGRIAGIINNRANDTWNQNNARFGFVDFINDNEVVDKLFEVVEEWAKEKGMDMIQGPMGFTDMDHEGLLINGFDQMGTQATIYNYAYYPRQLERIGFTKDQDWLEYKIKIPKDIPEKHKKLAEIVKNKYRLKTVEFKKRKDLYKYSQRIFETINQAYSVLYGYSELSPAQIKYYVDMYMPFVRMEYVTVIVREDDDKVIGVAITIPNLSKGLKKANGSLLPLGWAYVLNDLKSKQNKVIDLYLIAVVPEYQNKGVIAMIFENLIPEYNKNGVEYAESNPELETNRSIQLQWDYFEKKHHKTRRAYIKKL